MSSSPRLPTIAAALLLSVAATAGVASAVAAPTGASAAVAESPVRYRTIEIDGVDVFYREAGSEDAPVVVLLHGFPTSSHMFRNLIPALAGRYRVIAPDYPGFGHSEVPDRAKFQYTFAHFAEIVDALLSRLNAKHYALYVMDYGAPVGYRLALAHPERVSALIVQNGNAYEDGLKEFWNPLRAFWSSGSSADREKVREALTLESIRWQYTDGVKDVSRIDPTTWVLDHALVSRPGNSDVQLDLIYDYRTNVELYPRFHAFFREHRPPTLIVWGRNDQIFHADGARAYLRDLPDAELHLLDTGHFALEDRGPEISRLIVDFLDRKLPRG